ncbi:S-layer homology domain-containing protein, partial [Agathobaculum hominis]
YKSTLNVILDFQSKATLSSIADIISMYVNGTVPTDLTVSYTGFVNGDTKETVVETDATASIAAEVDGKKTGTFDITTNENTVLKSGMDGNYTITVQNGTLTVSQRSSGGGSVSQTTNPITTPSKTDNGTVSVGSENAKQGDTVTITVTPDKGYTLETVTVTDKNGKTISVTKKSDTQYTFVMPAGKVEVKATFVEDNTMLNSFVDVHANDYYYDAVLWAAQKGVTAGTDATHFSPNASCTRAQIVTFLWRAAGSPEPKGTSSFADVSADSYYAKAVAWAVENGITGGTGNGKFSPDGTCTREQAVTFLYRAAGSPDVSGGSAFSDVAGNAYYADAVAWAEKNGVTGGIGGGLFGSGNDCTRGQIVTFLYRTIQGK